MHNNDTYEQLQNNADLLRLVSRYLPLTAGRKAHKGNCPFHPDQGQSLMVSEEKNIFKCFGCGKEGGPVEFVMAVQGLNRSEAFHNLTANLHLLQRTLL